MKRKILFYFILIIIEFSIGIITIICMTYLSNHLQIGRTGRNNIRDISEVLIILINVMWSIILIDESKIKKIISGLFSGVLIFLLAYLTEKFYNIDSNHILTLSILFGGQIIFWEILFKMRLIKLKSA